ncbi:Coiled-coil domain-containing protein 149 [Nymphon striatum]|nr:Coiled-coil domain-containing protein 149 [Nymphon striatum]
MSVKKVNSGENYENLQLEYSILKSKHASKVEAILILSKELENYRNERDQFKLMAEQLRERHSSLRKKVEGWGPSLLGIYEGRDQGEQGLIQLLCEFKEQNKALKAEVETLRQKLVDSNGDIKLLREQIARQRVGSFDEGISSRLYPAHERETLVKDLEATRLRCTMLEADLQALFDEKEELVTSRDEYKRKVERLNKQINCFMKGDEKKIIDVDSILMENRYLQERLKQTQEEKSMIVATLSKYKSMLEKKKTRFSSSRPNDSGAAVITHKQVQQLLKEELNDKYIDTPTNVADLRSLSIALYEALNDKKIALSHQRKANKILGNRVTELENKLKSTEVGGFMPLTDFDGVKRTVSTDGSEGSTEVQHDPGKSVTDQSFESPFHIDSPSSVQNVASSEKRSFNSSQSRNNSHSSEQTADESQIINEERKMRFAGHVMRGSSGDLLNLILEGSIEGVRDRGRQRRTWGDDVKEWSRTTSIGDAKRTAESRENWLGISFTQWLVDSVLPVESPGVAGEIILALARYAHVAGQPAPGLSGCQESQIFFHDETFKEESVPMNLTAIPCSPINSSHQEKSQSPELEDNDLPPASSKACERCLRRHQ